MPAEPNAVKPSEVFGRRLREVRKRRGWSQQQLAERVSDLQGAPMDRTTVAKIEAVDPRNARNVTIDEVFLFAAALSCAPLHLILPTDSGAEVAIVPTVSWPAGQVRDWFAGRVALGGVTDDMRVFLSEVEDWRLSSYEARLAAGNTDDVARDQEQLRQIGRLRAEEVAAEMAEDDLNARKETD